MSCRCCVLRFRDSSFLPHCPRQTVLFDTLPTTCQQFISGTLPGICHVVWGRGSNDDCRGPLSFPVSVQVNARLVNQNPENSLWERNQLNLHKHKQATRHIEIVLSTVQNKFFLRRFESSPSPLLWITLLVLSHHFVVCSPALNQRSFLHLIISAPFANSLSLFPLFENK